MARIEINLVINRPVEEVFAFVSNSENLPRWRSTSLEVKKTSTGPLGMGSTFKGRFTFLGRQFDGNVVVTAYELNRVYMSKIAEGPFPLETGYTLEPVENGTHVTFVVEGAPGGFFKLAEPLVVSMAKRAYEADLHNLKDMLEAQAVQVA
jgi:uncharacterized protein YndB with AHSA1/START domain